MKIDLADKIPQELLMAAMSIYQKLSDSGYEAYLVGGCVRDLLLDLPVREVDMTSNCLPSKLMQLFPGSIPVGIEFGTVIVRINKVPVEVTTYRHDFDYTDGRRPGKISFGNSLKEDVLRRDFTINGLAIDPVKNEVIDHVSGFIDIQQSRLRTIGDPLERFAEDGLRSIRGCRFAARLGLTIEKNTFDGMAQMRRVTEKVSRERFFEEWKKTIADHNRFKFWIYLEQAGLLNLFLKTSYNFNEKSLKEFCSFKRINSMGVYAAYLLQALSVNLNEISGILKYLKFPNKEINLTLELLKFSTYDITSEFQLRSALTAISRNNRVAFRRYISEHPNYKQKLVLIVKQFKNSQLSLSVKELNINGNDLKSMIPGLEGKQIGEKLAVIHEANLRGEIENSKESLTRFAAKRFKR